MGAGRYIAASMKTWRMGEKGRTDEPIYTVKHGRMVDNVYPEAIYAHVKTARLVKMRA
jgi:hypothetical protein